MNLLKWGENVEKIKLSDCTLNLNKFEAIIAVCTFGSYNESCFDKNRSDIDVMLLLNKELQWEMYGGL